MGITSSTHRADRNKKGKRRQLSVGSSGGDTISEGAKGGRAGRRRGARDDDALSFSDSNPGTRRDLLRVVQPAPDHNEAGQKKAKKKRVRIDQAPPEVNIGALKYDSKFAPAFENQILFMKMCFHL